MTESILVALDGSDHAFKALDLACDLASQRGAKLWLLHVMGNHQVPEGLRHWAEAEHVQESPQFVWETAVSQKILHAGMSRASQHGVESVETLSNDGDPATCILDTARTRHVDMIVMGTRGIGGLKGMVMGSVAHKVTHASEGTVVVR